MCRHLELKPESRCRFRSWLQWGPQKRMRQLPMQQTQQGLCCGSQGLSASVLVVAPMLVDWRCSGLNGTNQSIGVNKDRPKTKNIGATRIPITCQKNKENQ